MLRWILVISLICGVPLVGAGKKKKKAEPLAERVEALIAGTPALARGHLGFRVVDGQGKTILEHNARQWFVPASNTKLYSTALALTRLGPEYRLTTRVRAMAEPDLDGVIRGDLRFVGGGDPSLSGRTYPYDREHEWADVTPGIEELAEKIAARGVKRIEGAVVGDDTAFLWEPFPDGWSIDDPLFEYGAPVSALTLNDNSFRLEVRPGAGPGEAPEIYLFPDVGQVTVVPMVETVAAGEKSKIRLERPAHTNELRIYGTIAAGAKAYTTLLGVADPALYAAQALQDALARRGIAIREPARALHRTGLEEPGGDGSLVLAERKSPPLAELLPVVNKVSQNLHAELLLREAGRAGGSYGSQEKSAAVLQAFLENEAGVHKDDVHFTDGSGMSRLTLVTPEATTALLRFMAEREGWVSSLPVGGSDGTLRRRFTGEAVRERVRAKTGSLSHVSALGGYLEHPRLGRLVFTILLNNYNTPAAEARAGIDKLVATFLE